MGLDTSHDCWHGAYSTFMGWRKALSKVAGYGNLLDYQGFGGVNPWPNIGVIEKLLSHSDCDGSIESADCGPIADRLEELLPFFGEHSDERSEMAFFRGKTERFIIGLRKAAAAGEDVEFH